MSAAPGNNWPRRTGNVNNVAIQQQQRDFHDARHVIVPRVSGRRPSRDRRRRYRLPVRSVGPGRSISQLARVGDKWHY